MFTDMPPCPIGPVATKVCSKCRIEKPRVEFYGDKNRKDGKNPWCKECARIIGKIRSKNPEVRAQAAAWARARRANAEFRYRENEAQRNRRAANGDFKDSQREYWKNFYFDPANREARLQRDRHRRVDVNVRAQGLLSAAKQRDRNCTVTLDHVLSGILRGHCPVTGIAFDLTSDHQRLTGRSRNPYSPSIDRIDCRLGYTNENTRIVITHYNFMKGQLTDEEMKFICARVVECSK